MEVNIDRATPPPVVGVTLRLSVNELRRFVKSQQRVLSCAKEGGYYGGFRPGGTTDTLTKALAEIDNDKEER